MSARILQGLHDPMVPELLIQPGAVLVIPTDTVYGIVARVTDRDAVARLYALKSRERKPGTLIAADVAQLVVLGLDAGDLAAVRAYWPGPVSAIVKAGDELDYVHQGLHSLAVRVPANSPLQALLRQTGPLLTSSANQPGEPPAVDILHAQSYFGDAVDAYIDGGALPDALPSTIVRIENGALTVVREGAAKIEPKELSA